MCLCVSSPELKLNICLFSSRLKSTEYVELQDKLHAPIRNAANVVIHLTMSELFLDTFKSYVRMNDVYRCPSGQVKALFLLYFQNVFFMDIVFS